MKATAILISGLLISSSGFGQIVNTAIVDANNVEAIISDESSFFNDPINNVAGYQVPAGSGKTTIYSASMWAGALDNNGQLHLSKAIFGSGNWHSGPIADPMHYGTPAYSNAYQESIWKVTRQEVDLHIQQYQQMGYVIPQGIADWPGNGDVSLGVAQQLAPFVDLNGDGIYAPQDGDYPEFPGDQVVYVIVNDESYQPDGNELGAEVHMMFYQFIDQGYLGETTFLNLRTFNRSTTNYYDFRQSIYMDFDIGNYQDDYIGCDSVRNLMYGYNGDAFDEAVGGTPGYGSNPPCQAVTCLNHDMVAAMYFTNGSAFPLSDPNTDVQAWYNMNGLWADGSPVYYGGNGYNSGGVTTTPSAYTFSGNPYTGSGWTELTADNGSPNPPEDRRGVMTVAIGDLPAGGSVCADFAFISNNDDGHLENVQNVLNIADALQNLYDSSNDFGCGMFTLGNPGKPEAISGFKVFPNPSAGTFTVQVDNLPSDGVLNVFNLSGTSVFASVLSETEKNIALDVAPGCYLVTISGANYHAVERIIIE